MNDPYKTLGVSAKATPDEIKTAYRNLAKKFHPDLNPGNKTAEQKFKEIAGAYEIVGAPENRAKFDRGEWDTGQNTSQPGGGARHRSGPFYRETQGGGSRYGQGFEGYEGFDDSIFENLFRNSRGQGQPGFSSDETYRMDVGLREAILGGEKEIQLPSGKRLAVKIPPGIFEGQKLRFAGQGTSGDVLIELHIQSDSRFSQEGAQLRYELQVPIDVAVLGGSVNVPTPEGQVNLQIPPHSNGGKKLRIPGKGSFVRGDKKRGDLIVTLSLRLPDPMDPALEASLKEWKQKREGRAS